MAAKKYASAPACNGKKFYVEVSGLNHSSLQDFVFYDLTDMSEKSALSAKKTIDPQLEESTVYSWDWCDETENRNVWLSIEGTNGPINLPLFDDVTAINRQQGEQKYLVHSFVPMTLLPTFQSNIKDEDRIAPVRDGYVYIAYNGKIWREVKVSASEAGEPCFEDIDLFKYREARDKRFKEETKREVSGKALKEIWFPVKENDSRTDVRFAYSEVQWSAARLNYLEAHLDELKARMEKAPSVLPIALTEDNGTHKKVPELRYREDELELRLAEPARFNHDISGANLASSLESAKVERDEYCLHDEFTHYQEMQFEYEARSSVLSVALWKGQQAAIKREEAEQAKEPTESRKMQLEQAKADLGKEPDLSSWNAEGQSDYLTDAKARKLRLLALSDEVFAFRHNLAILQYAQSFLQQLQLDATQQKHFKSAELVQSFVLSPKIGEQDNPNYKQKKLVNRKAHSSFQRTLRTHWRDLVRSDILLLQKALLKKLKAEPFAQALRDIVSLDDHNVFGAHILVNTARNALQSSADEDDRFVMEHKRRSFVPMLKQINTLFTQESTALIKSVLLGDERTQETLAKYLDEVSDTAPYVLAMQSATGPLNDGSGFSTVERMAELVSQKATLKPDGLQQVEAATLIRINENAEQDEFPQVRRFVDTINSILSSYFSGAIALTKALADTDAVTRLSFNKLYLSSLAMAKMLGGDEFKTLTFAPVTGAKIEGYVIGLDGSGLSVGEASAGGAYRNTAGRRISHGDVAFDGEQVASTSKARMAKVSSDFALEEDLRLVVLKDINSDAAQYLKKNHKALDELKNNRLSRSNAYEKLNLPLFILMVEMKNCWNAVNYLYVNGGKDSYYAIANAFSALADISVAATHARNLMKSNTGRLFALSDTTAMAFGPDTVARWSSPRFKVQLSGRVVLLEVIGSVAGLITAGLMVWDTIRLWGKNDKDAALGTAMMAFGVAFGSIAGLFFTPTSTLLGLGPVGWVALIITLAGFTITYLFTDSPLEAWLKNGPFGDDPAMDDDDYAFLSQQPDQAYLQLLNLFIGVKLAVGKIEQAPLTKDERLSYNAAGITHFVLARSNVAQLFNYPDNKVTFEVKFREVLEQVSENIDEIYARERMKATFGEKAADTYRSPQWQVKEQRDISPQITLERPEGKLYLFINTFTEKPSVVKSSSTLRYQRNIQALAQVVAGELVFPQPPLDKVVETLDNVKEQKIAMHQANFNDGQTEGFWEMVLNEPKKHPANYYWADSRNKAYLISAE